MAEGIEFGPGDQAEVVALRIAEALSACRTLRETLDVLAAELPRALSANLAALYLVNEERDRLRLERRGGLDRPIGDEVALDPGSPVPVARAAVTGEVAISEDGHELALPLTALAERLGCLLLHFPSPVRPAPAELAGLRGLGLLAAAAIEGTRSRDKRRELEERIRALTAASAAISGALAIPPESNPAAGIMKKIRLWPGAQDSVQRNDLAHLLHTALRTILDQAVQTVGAEFGAIGIGEDPTEPFEPWIFAGVPNDQAAAMGRHPRPVGTLGLVAREGKTLRAEDIRRHPAFHGFPANHPEVTSLLAVPIRSRGLNFGNFYLGNKVGASAFSAEDQEILELMAAQAAISLQSAYFRATFQAYRAQLETILETSPCGLLFIDARSDDVIANPRATELLGRIVTPGSGRAQYLAQILSPEGRPVALGALPSTRALAGERIWTEEFVIAQPGGRHVPVMVSAAPVTDTDRNTIGAIVAFEDVSAVKVLECSREEFAAVVAHDLRDPIQAILFHVDLLRRQRVGDEVRGPWSLVQRIEQNALRLRQMTSDLLDAMRVDLKRIDLDRKPLDVGATVRGLVERLLPVFGRHRILVDEDEPVSLSLDVLRFEQVLTNLLDNAAKFSAEEAPITVRIARREGGVAVSVEDQGVGIPRAEFSRLFDRFYQSGRARERKTGLGLGLYISKGLVEAQGGRLSVESEPGKGSVFRAWFPGGPQERST